MLLTGDREAIKDWACVPETSPHYMGAVCHDPAPHGIIVNGKTGPKSDGFPCFDMGLGQRKGSCPQEEENITNTLRVGEGRGGGWGVTVPGEKPTNARRGGGLLVSSVICSINFLCCLWGTSLWKPGGWGSVVLKESGRLKGFGGLYCGLWWTDTCS